MCLAEQEQIKTGNTIKYLPIGNNKVSKIYFGKNAKKITITEEQFLNEIKEI